MSDAMPASGPNPPEEIYVLVQVTVGSRNLYKLEDVPTLDKVFEAPLPAAYGIIPETHHIDAEPLDAFVLVSEPSLPGAVVPARPIGLVRLDADGMIDDKVIAVCSIDGAFAKITDVKDLPASMRRELEAALQANWKGKITWHGPDRAFKAITHAIELYKREFG